MELGNLVLSLAFGFSSITYVVKSFTKYAEDDDTVTAMLFLILANLY